MNPVTMSALDEMSRVDIQTVDPDTLVDIRDVEIDHELPKEARVLNFIEKIKNPYCCTGSYSEGSKRESLCHFHKKVCKCKSINERDVYNVN